MPANPGEEGEEKEEEKKEEEKGRRNEEREIEGKRDKEGKKICLVFNYNFRRGQRQYRNPYLQLCIP